ncbi:MAG: hypothetical protein IJ861_07055 [Clostridia bacterium]|nr:hypothetical protein [Clostridia bacterium]
MKQPSVTFKGKNKEQLISMFGQSDSKEADSVTFNNVPYFDYSSKALYDELLAKFRTIGDDGEMNYPKNGQVEQTVHLTNDRDFVIGYEDSSDGNYTYFFTRY